jgi:hypothetical protein
METIAKTTDCGVTACTDCIDLNLWNHNDTGVAKTEDGLDLSWGEMMSLATCSPCNFCIYDVEGSMHNVYNNRIYKPSLRE